MIFTSDKFNRQAPAFDKEECDDMNWAGLVNTTGGGGGGHGSPRTEDLPIIRRPDLENHNKVRLQFAFSINIYLKKAP